MDTTVGSTELMQEKLNIEQEIIEIESQLQLVRKKARITGVYADIEWFHNTIRDLNNKKLQVKRLNIMISDMRLGDYNAALKRENDELKRLVARYEALLGRN